MAAYTDMPLKILTQLLMQLCHCQTVQSLENKDAYWSH